MFKPNQKGEKRKKGVLMAENKNQETGGGKETVLQLSSLFHCPRVFFTQSSPEQTAQRPRPTDAEKYS